MGFTFMNSSVLRAFSSQSLGFTLTVSLVRTSNYVKMASFRSKVLLRKRYWLFFKFDEEA